MIENYTAVPNLIAGIVVVLAGIAIVIYRRPLTSAIVKRERSIVGRRAATSLGQLQTPFWVGMAGVGFIVVGGLFHYFSIRAFLG